MIVIDMVKRTAAMVAFIAFVLGVFSCSGGEKGGLEASDTCDILIVGGGVGGFAAAYQACTMASEYGITRIVMTEETAWPGGQYTSQGVTASDDNSLVEQGRYNVAASEAYFDFHETIKNYYRAAALETAEKTERTGQGVTAAERMEKEWIESTQFSPGNAWGSRMSFLPKDGVHAIEDMLRPYVESGLLTIHYRTVPVAVDMDGARLTGVTFERTGTNERMTVNAAITLDATELGDLLPLTNTPYRIGIEASEDTGEPSLFDDDGNVLYPEPMRDCQQSFTYTFAVEWRPETEDNRLPWEDRPASYEANRHRFTMIDANRWFLMKRWNDYARMAAYEEMQKGGEKRPMPWIPSFWTYRRMLDARLIDPGQPASIYPRFINGQWEMDFNPEDNPRYFVPNWEHSEPAVGDIIEVNWGANDYTGGSIIDVSPEMREQRLKEAKELSLSFMYWLWYEAPRDPDDPKLDPAKEQNWPADPVTGKNQGYANLKYRPDVMGTEDGLSMYPYIRESRRVKALFTVMQQHLLAPRTERAELFHDTVGIGHYFLDIHRCDVGDEVKRDINFKHVQLSDGSWAGENSSGRFQIPYGSLVPEITDGLICAAKNIGLTRIAAATYRLHPVEFEIGKAAGAAAALCVAWDAQPRDLWVAEPASEPTEAEKRLRKLQQVLLDDNTPLFWNEDAGWDTDVFEAVQWVCSMKIMNPAGRNFEPEAKLTRADAVRAIVRAMAGFEPDPTCTVRFTDIPFEDTELVQALSHLEQLGAFGWIQGSMFEPDGAIYADEFMEIMMAAFPETDLDAGLADGDLTRGDAAKLLAGVVKARFGL